MSLNSCLRDYRKDFSGFNVTYKESDLYIYTDNKQLKKEAYLSLLKYRNIIEKHIRLYPDFLTSLVPLEIPLGKLDEIIYIMYKSGKLAGVGPFAAVAGAIAEFVAKDLTVFSNEIIVENGGDIFIIGKEEKVVKIFSGRLNSLGLKIKGEQLPIAVCSSSSRIGHSLSTGNAELVVVLSEKGAYADAFATSICNDIKDEKSIEKNIIKYKKIKEIIGCLIYFNNKISGWGELELVKIN